MRDKYEFVVIGGGAAGFAAATKADELGVETALINGGLPMGGTCVNVGCVPSKHLLEVSHDFFYPPRSSFPSVRIPKGTLDFRRAISHKDALVSGLRKRNYADVLASWDHIEYIDGRATFVDPKTIRVNGQKIAGERFLVATGSSARVPPIPGLEDVPYLTHLDAMSLQEVPESLLVLGAGPLGLEFAQMYAHMGSRVTVLEVMPRILPMHEPEVAGELARCLREEGMEIRTKTEAKRIDERGGERVLRAKGDGGEEEVRAADILVATGIEANTKGLGLDQAAVELTPRGFVKVDRAMRTTARHIWAAGDVTGSMALETLAAKEGNVAASNALAGAGRTIDYDTIPHAVFTNPQVASVGLTEAKLMEREHVCACRTAPMSAVSKAMAIEDTRGLLKLVVNPRNGKIVGVHVVSPVAAEIVTAGVYAIRAGWTVDDIIDTVHVFPTMTEALKLAAQAFRRDITKMSCCVE